MISSRLYYISWNIAHMTVLVMMKRHPGSPTRTP